MIYDHASSNSPELDPYTDIGIAVGANKEIILVCLNQDFELPPQLQSSVILVSRSNYDREEIIKALEKDLLRREYPAPSFVYDPAGDYWLTQARDQVINNYGHDSTYFRDLFYLKIFNDLYNKTAKRAAIRDLGYLRGLRGLIVAALQADPQEDIRAEAALALAKFDDYDVFHDLHEVARFEYPKKVKLYAEIALEARQNPNMIEQLVTDLIDVFRRDQQEYFDFSTPNPILLQTPHMNSSTPPSQHQLFISYARKDAEGLAIELARKLQTTGFSVWIDTKLEPGTPAWTQAVEDAIRQTEIMIVLVSPAANTSIWVKREIRVAEDAHKDIIPITAIRTGKPLELSVTQGLRGDPVLSEEPEQVLNLLLESLRRKGITSRFGVG